MESNFMKKWVIVKALIFIVIFFSGCSSEPPEAWEELNLGTKKIAGAMVHYEKCFEEKLGIFEKAYKQLQTTRKKNQAQKVLENKDKIIADINGILGITETDTKMQNEMLVRFVGIFSGANSTFYLVKQSTIKDFLRGGGELPNFSYDKQTDTVNYRLTVGETSESCPLKEFELSIPISSEESFEEEIAEIFKALGEAFGYVRIAIALHETVEMSLLLRVKPRDAYQRWFSDGFANAITIELLKRYVNNESADEFAADFDISKYNDLEKEINLLYWMSAKFCIFGAESPIEYEDRLILGRYNYATFEAQRLIDKYGIDCVVEILDEVCKGDSRTSKELFAAIKTVTGEDMVSRLERYQTFKNRKEGLAKYTDGLDTASNEKNYEEMLINLLRVMELEENQFSPSSLESWKNAAWLLFLLGHEDIGDGVMSKCFELFSQIPDSSGRKAALEGFIVYALKCQKPQKAEEAAQEMLLSHPEHIPSLTVKMVVSVQSKELEEAKEIAKKILSLTEKGSLPYKLASQTLGFKPNSGQEQ